MATSLVITLREGIEAALVLGIILTYLQRTGNTALNRYVYWGLGLAVMVSIVVGIVLQVIGFDSETLEGPTLAIGGIFVASMVLWMWRTAKNLRGHLESKMGNIMAEGKISRGTAIGFFAFTFFMVAREGVETVLFLAAATLGQSNIMDLIGGVLGICLAALFAVLFIRGSLKINLRRFFNVTSIVLLVLAARLIAGSLHEFAERGVIPMSAGVMQVLGYFVRDRASSILMMGLVLVPIILVLIDFRHADAAAVVPEGNAAEQRKWRASQRWGRTMQLSLVGATAVVLLAMASQAFAADPFIDPPPQTVTASGDAIRLPTDGWTAGTLQKFAYRIGDTSVRFQAVKLPDGGIATALDACQICGSKGYMQQKDGNVIVCKLCNAPIPMTTMGEGGGCNPLPLPSYTEGNTLVVPLKGLEDRVQLFSDKRDQP